jgi:broad specificity phosphatase PhoE
MAKRLLLVRHGRLGANYVGRLVGATDLPLEPAGQLQGQALADRVMRWAPQTCFCSPLQRCRQMAALVAPNLPPQVDRDLREIDFGRWETWTFTDAAAQDPSLVDRWAEMSPQFAFPGGENLGDFLGRVRAAADRLTRAEAQTVLAVTHGGVIRAMICCLLGLAPDRYVAFDVPYAAMVVIDLFDGRGVLAALERPETTEDAHG